MNFNISREEKQIVIFILFMFDTNKSGIHVVISRVLLIDWSGQKLSLKEYLINTKI